MSLHSQLLEAIVSPHLPIEHVVVWRDGLIRSNQCPYCGLCHSATEGVYGLTYCPDKPDKTTQAVAILAAELWLKANFVKDIDCEAVLRQTKAEVFVMLKNCFHNIYDLCGST